MSNGRRKCVRNDDSAVMFVGIRWKTNNLTTHVLEKSVTISHVMVEKRGLRRTRRSKKLKRR
jgi:hypothetical protein